MFIKVTANRTVTLEGRDDFRAFKLVVEGPREALAEVRAALSGVAQFADADTSWVSVEWLRCSAGVAQDAAWQQSLSAMIEKARPHGWIDDARKAIKAHVEWTR
jgi:hypothetical protein